MHDDLPNGFVVSDSSKVKTSKRLGTARKAVSGYDIKSFPSQASSVLSSIGPILAAIQLIGLVNYLRLLANATAETTSIIPMLLLAAQSLEFSTVITDLIISLTGQLLCKQKSRPKRRIYGNNVPGVDVLITTCKEDVDIVMDTVRAAATLDWPADKLRVLVSDDGFDIDLKAAVEILGLRFPYVHYYSRPKVPGKHHGYKAGNMNQALRHLASNEFEGRTNEWIAILDADMIPNAKWLRAVIPHVLIDSDIAMVATPQDFYNLPVNDPLHENLALQHEAEQSLRDKMGAAWCTGSGFLFYRPAWEKVGGFSETSMCDDMLFGWTLNGYGYKTAAISERLQHGMQPSSFAEHIKQRRRWYIGGMKNAMEIKFGFNNKIWGDSSAWQKLAALNQIPKPFIATIGKLLSWLLVFVCVMSGSRVVEVDGAELAPILASYALFLVSTRISEYMLASNGFGIQNIRRRQIVSTWQGLHLSKACLQEIVPKWLGGGVTAFAVTGQKLDAPVTLEERDPIQRPGMLERIRRLHQLEDVLVHLSFFMAMASVLTMNGIRLYLKAYGETKPFVHALIVSILFPPLRLENLMCFLSPIWYIMFPPTEKPREQYLTEDQDTGFRRPLLWECGPKFTRGMYVWEAWYLAATAWAVCAWWFVARDAGLI